jgi:hypothetical protein
MGSDVCGTEPVPREVGIVEGLAGNSELDALEKVGASGASVAASGLDTYDPLVLR